MFQILQAYLLPIIFWAFTIRMVGFLYLNIGLASTFTSALTRTVSTYLHTPRLAPTLIEYRKGSAAALAAFLIAIFISTRSVKGHNDKELGDQASSLLPDFESFSLLAELDSVSNVRYGLLVIMALSSLTVYSIILAGWASNSKYAFIGALRSAAQMISYEVSITLILLPVILLCGSLNLVQVVYGQILTVWYLLPLLPAAIIFAVAMLAETNRTPFDLPEAEAELVAGYNVDYSSLPFAMFFLGEYSNMTLMAVLFCLLFLGGWALFFAGSAFLLVAKAAFVWCFFVIVRATLPRYRYDQLMDIGWKAFLPVASGYLFLVLGLAVFFYAAPVVYEACVSSYAFPVTSVSMWSFWMLILSGKGPGGHSPTVNSEPEWAPLVKDFVQRMMFHPDVLAKDAQYSKLTDPSALDMEPYNKAMALAFKKDPLFAISSEKLDSYIFDHPASLPDVLKGVTAAAEAAGAAAAAAAAASTPSSAPADDNMFFYLLIAAAAVLTIGAGIFVYYRWFAPWLAAKAAANQLANEQTAETERLEWILQALDGLTKSAGAPLKKVTELATDVTAEQSLFYTFLFGLGVLVVLNRVENRKVVKQTVQNWISLRQSHPVLLSAIVLFSTEAAQQFKLICLEVTSVEHFVTDYSFTGAQLLPSWLLVTFFLFFTGLLGMMYNYRSFLITMMSVEVMYLGNVTSFVLYGAAYHDTNALIYALLILIFAACESAVGLGLLIVLYRFGHSVAFNSYTTLHSGVGALIIVLAADTVSAPLFSRALHPLMSSQYAQGYFGMALYLFLALALCALLATLAYLLSLSTSQDTEKRSEYECGFAPFDSATRLPFDVHFYLVGILFLIFDVEVALLFPWTLSLTSLSWFGLYNMVGFILVLTIGFIYEWKRGALIWPSRQRQGHARAFVFILPQTGTRLADMLPSTATFDSLLPDFTLFGVIAALLLVAAIYFGSSRSMKRATTDIFYAMLAGLSAIVVITAIEKLDLTQASSALLEGYLYTSYYISVMKLLVLSCALFVLYAAGRYVQDARRPLLEFPIVLAFALLFMVILVSSNHLMAAFFALSGFSLNMYVLILFDAPSHVSREAGIKYYYLSTLSTGLILYGAFLLYVLGRSGNFNVMDLNLSAYTIGNVPTMLTLGVLLTFIGFMFKLSAFPGHLWAPDVYEGSPAPVTAYFMLPVKIAVLSFFMRYLTSALEQVSHVWITWLSLACVGSIIWGAFTALYARNTRRFLAFTSINQMGFLLIGLVCNSTAGYRATILYLFIYALMSVAFLLIFIQTRRADGYPLLYLADFRGFGQSRWLHAWAIVTALFSMAGIPPLAGFFGKYYLLIQAMEDGLFTIVIIALATSLVSTYYYLRLIKIMWFEGTEAMTPATCELSTTSLTLLFISEGLTWLFVFFAPTMLDISGHLAESLLHTAPTISTGV